jgi:hypothetical protein
MQARANALETLNNQGLLGAGNRYTSSYQLQELIMQQNIDIQLLAMKQQLQIEGPNASLKQIEGPTNT